MSKKNAIFFSCNERFIFTLSVALLSLKKYGCFGVLPRFYASR